MTDPTTESTHDRSTPRRADEITALLMRVNAGDAQSAEELMSIVYQDLRAIAGAVARRQGPNHTLQPTALVNEVWIKLAKDAGPFESRKHFFVIAAKAMRQILIDHARAAKRLKRGGDGVRVTLAHDPVAPAEASFDLMTLADSLQRLAQLNERHARVIEYRLFGMLSLAETAEVLGVSLSTVKTDWKLARAWLWGELMKDDDARSPL